MASYSPKLLERKYNNWVKAQLAILVTKEGIEPFVCQELQEFQLKCLNDICYNNGLISGTLCSNCSTENVVKCPTNRICNIRGGRCNYHHNSATKYNPAGCPIKLCHNFKTEIQNVHRFNGPSYKNTDATQWCSNSWEVAKCFMPPDGYKDVVCAQETDFNGIISVIINNKTFQLKVHEILSNKANIFEQARDIGRKVRHSPTLEVDDKDLQQFFNVFQQLLSDTAYLATDTHAQNAKQKLLQLENDTLIIGKDDIRKALDDVAKAARDTIRIEKDDQKRQYEISRADMIQRKQDDLLSLDKKAAEGLQKIENTTDDSLKAIKKETGKGVREIEKIKEDTVKELHEKKRKNEEDTELQSKRIKEECKMAVGTIKEQGDKGEMNLANLAETIEKTLYTRIKEVKERTYIDCRRKVKDELIKWYKTYQSTVPLSPLKDDFDTPLAGFYIMPEIDIQTNLPDGRREKTRVKSLQELFTSDLKVLREIYLSAVAGFGKTAFSKYVAITWCQTHQKDENYAYFKEDELKAFSGFDFVFLVLLRDSTKVCNIDDMIEQQVIQNLPCSTSTPKDLLQDILSKERCLIILDGLDEWTHPDNDCTKLPKSIPHRYARERCVILTTTRPWKLGVSNLKTSQISKTAELVQLNKDSAWQLKLNAMKILKGNLQGDELKSEVCRFEEEIRDHDIEDMKSTPLLLFYLLCLWVGDISIGNSTVDLYTGIMQLLLSRTEKIHGNFHSCYNTFPPYNFPESFRKHNHCCRYYTFLVTLGKLAFYTLFCEKKENTLVFGKNVAEEYLNPEDFKLSLFSGILSETQVKTLINEKSKISFSHKTVHEFLTALYISFESTIDVKKIIMEECNCLQNIVDKSKVFVFLCKMKPELMLKISHDLMHVINNDDKTRKYRTMTLIDYMYLNPIKDIQDMYISCSKEFQETKDPRLCLQDFYINEKCQRGNTFKKLQHLCHQNKENIKSIMIHNKGICSLEKISNLFSFAELPKIEKLYYQGEIGDEELIRLLLNPLKCLTMMSSKWNNNQFEGEFCRVSAEINGQLINLQQLDILHMNCFTMSHKEMEQLLNFLTSKRTMKEITLYNLLCSDHTTSCPGFNLDLSEHIHPRHLGLGWLSLSQLNINVSLLEECTVVKLYKPGVVSSYLSQLPAASKLQSFSCDRLESSTDIEKMLQTLPLLLYVKHVKLAGINLGINSLILSPQMVRIEFVYLLDITMSCSMLNDLITVINKLPHTVTVQMVGCEIKPQTEFENLKTLLKRSNSFVVIHDVIAKSGQYVFQFDTIKRMSNEVY